MSNATLYLFTVPEGKITYGFHLTFGRKVYFASKGYIITFYIGTPLNKSAVDDLKQSNVVPNISYSIKEWADLSEAVKNELKVCYEEKDKLTSYSG